MTLEEVEEGYRSLIKEETVKLSLLKKKIFRVGTLRLVLVLACIALCIMLWGNGLLITGIIFALVVVFLFLLKYHNRLYTEKRYTEILIINAQNELKGINYDYSAFDGAAEAVDASHRFTVDLDIFGQRSIFQSVNRAVSSYGKKHLIDIFANPLEDKEQIEKRQAAVQELSTDIEFIKKFRALGAMYDDEGFDIKNISAQFSSGINSLMWRILQYVIPVLFLSTIVLYALNYVSDSFFIIAWVVAIAVSSIPMKSINKKLNRVGKKADLLQSYSNLFRLIENEKIDSPELVEIQHILLSKGSASVAISKLKYLISNLEQGFTFVGILFLNPLLMWTVRYAIKTEKWMREYDKEIAEWFDALGKIDALVSLSVYAYNHPDYTYPEITDSYGFEAVNLGHPLIKRDVCVRNDVSLHQRPFFLVVTGANMAGKSTYFRTVGVSLMFAGIGLPVCADKLKCHPFRLVTNLRTSDSLNDNESYFFAELKRLKMIIDRLQSGEKLFIILDEILKGTNSEDKQKGSIALMKQLVSLKGNGIIATHDLELGNLEAEFPEAVKNHCFEADIKNDRLSFSYKIREGVAQNMNACFLMRQMGITGL